MLVRLAYLAVSNTSTALRLLPMSNRDKDIEILSLRHQIAVLQRQLAGARPTFDAADRAFLAALLAPLPRQTLRRLRLTVHPDTVLRWHRNLLKQHHAQRSRRKHLGRPRTVASIRRLVLRLVHENPGWGYRRVHGELTMLGIKIAASTVWQILTRRRHRSGPRTRGHHLERVPAQPSRGILDCDFLETVTLSGQRHYVLAVIEHATRRIHILGATPHLTAAWVTQAARNLVMDLQHTAATIKYLIRDHDAKFPALFDQVLTDAGIAVVLTGIRMPRMNAVMERWVRTCRSELLNRTLIWNQTHLLHVLHEFETHYNQHRPHRTLHQAAPLRPAPEPITEQARIIHLDIRRRDRLDGTLHEYEHAA